jgi:exopolyphosphatase / guanosine-5'-triphosphate,3'-diphosphate pyrophosphatase
LRRACIDIGSNTTRLLVADCADGTLEECGQERVFNQIGRSLDANGEIPEPTLHELAAVVSHQIGMARELGAEQIRCVATAGVRRARNSATLQQLLDGLADGVKLEILTGEQEARFAFAGAVWAAAPDPGTHVAVVDAGGGSSEIVAGTAPAEVRWWHSLPIGSGDLTARWLAADPPTAEELQSAREEIAAAIEPLTAPADVERVIAVGGSATSLRTLVGPLLDAEAIELLSAVAQRRSSAEVAARFGVDPQRARLLAGGLLILEAISVLFGAPLEVGGGGLREGVLLTGEVQG